MTHLLTTCKMRPKSSDAAPQRDSRGGPLQTAGGPHGDNAKLRLSENVKLYGGDSPLNCNCWLRKKLTNKTISLQLQLSLPAEQDFSDRGRHQAGGGVLWHFLEAN